MDTPPTLASFQLGVWEIWMKESKSSLSKITRLKQSYRVLKRCGLDIYFHDPPLFAIFVLGRFWSSIEGAILLHLSARFLITISSIARGEHNADLSSMIVTVVLRMAFAALAGVIKWWMTQIKPVLEQRIRSHFDTMIMGAKLRDDLLSSEDQGSKDHITSSQVFRSVEDIMDYFSALIETISHLVIVIHSSWSDGGLAFTILCVSQPVFVALQSKYLWDIPHLAHVTNADFLRRKALNHLTSEKFRRDAIDGNMKGYLVNEFAQANKKLSHITFEEPYQIYQKRNTPYHDVLSQLLGELPMVFYVLVALSVTRVSLASVAILQQSSSSLRASVRYLFMCSTSFRRSLVTIRETYDLLDAPKVNSGSKDVLPYPPQSMLSSSGMRIEIQNVSFKYPKSELKEPALDNISLTIQPGSLVIVVGGNGSGKSTLIKLLSRMYDPTSGGILFDGTPMKDFDICDLRRAIVTLSQDHNIYPLTLRENVGLGNIELVDDIGAIEEANRMAGADGCIAKLEHGLDTILDFVADRRFMRASSDQRDPLWEKFKSWNGASGLSGGEKQRVVAARTFMAFTSGRIRLCLVDEPTSAIDAAGELKLFDSLREAQDGKTMIFVTHRFGHLTKYADMIICMKDGKILETGNHTELMDKDGEYANLFNIQAQAFAKG